MFTPTWSLPALRFDLAPPVFRGRGGLLFCLVFSTISPSPATMITVIAEEDGKPPLVTLKVELAETSARHRLTSDGGPRFCEGELLRYSAISPADGFLSLFLTSSDGRTVRIFPRAGEEEEGRVIAGQTLALPGIDADFQIEVATPFGRETLTALVTREPLLDNSLPQDVKDILAQGEHTYDTFAGPPQSLLPSIQNREDRFALMLPLVVYFETGSSRLQGPSNQAVLQVVADALCQGSLARMHLRIEGHCDSTGTALSNLELGKTRAESVADALERLGVARQRMIVDSRGDYEPAIDDPEAPESVSFNRRVELLIIDPAGPRHGEG